MDRRDGRIAPVGAKSLIPQQAVLGVGQNTVQHSIPTLRLTRKGNNVWIAVYRTVANGDGSTYYRVGVVGNNIAADRRAFLDQISDAVLIAGQPLYTDGSVLENIAPPPCKTYVAHRGRLLVGGVDGDPTAVWQSKNVTQGFGVSFNDALVSRVNSADPVTALGSMDSYAVAFTDTTTWASSDEYPDDTGGGGVLRFNRASDTNGCMGPRLVASTDEGLVAWQGKKIPGPWLLSRGLTWSWIGAPAQLDAAAFTTVRALVAVPGLNQIRVIGQSTANGAVMVFETTFKTWSLWTYLVGTPTIVDACLWQGTVAYLTSTGTVILEDPALYGDSATAIAHSIAISNFIFAGVGGYQRIYTGQLTGRTLGVLGDSETMSILVTQTPDKTAMAAKSLTISPDNDGTFGVEFDPGPNGKCSTYQVTVSNTAGGANNPLCAWTLAGVSLEVGIKPNLNRLPPAKRAV
jgi:hypothetical protein